MFTVLQVFYILQEFPLMSMKYQSITEATWRKKSSNWLLPGKSANYKAPLSSASKCPWVIRAVSRRVKTQDRNCLVPARRMRKAVWKLYTRTANDWFLHSLVGCVFAVCPLGSKALNKLSYKKPVDSVTLFTLRWLPNGTWKDTHRPSVRSSYPVPISQSICTYSNQVHLLWV